MKDKGAGPASRILCESALVVVLALMLAGGCDWFNDPVEANLPPETVMVTCPGDGSVTAGDDVTLAWSGSDPDGSVARYEWTLNDTLSGETPDLSMEIQDVPEGTHVFEVAAVDNDGEADPTPAVCEFTASAAGGLVQRVVLVELLTTKFCTYCWVAELALARALEQYGRDELCVIAYHYDDDPLIPPDPVANDDSNARGDWYYDNTAVGEYYSVFPISIFDGDRFLVGAADTTAAKQATDFEIDLRREIGSPISLTLQGSISGGRGSISVGVRVRDALPAGSNVLRIVVVEDGIVDGGYHWDFVARDVLDEEVLTVSSAGDTTTVTRDFTVDAGWDAEGLDVIAIVQNESTAEVLQSGRLLAE